MVYLAAGDRSESSAAHLSKSMFDDYSLDPRSNLTLLCLFTAFVFWNNDILFFTFATMAICTRVLDRI